MKKDKLPKNPPKKPPEGTIEVARTPIKEVQMEPEKLDDGEWREIRIKTTFQQEDEKEFIHSELQPFFDQGYPAKIETDADARVASVFLAFRTAAQVLMTFPCRFSFSGTTALRKLLESRDAAFRSARLEPKSDPDKEESGWAATWKFPTNRTQP